MKTNELKWYLRVLNQHLFQLSEVIAWVQFTLYHFQALLALKPNILRDLNVDYDLLRFLLKLILFSYVAYQFQLLMIAYFAFLFW